MGSDLQWDVRERVAKYLKEKEAIGLVKACHVIIEIKDEDMPINGFRIKVSPVIWKKIILPEIKRITKKYQKKEYKIRYRTAAKPKDGVYVYWD